MPLFEIALLILVFLGILIFSISVHESSHAWMAERLGDPTARSLGRISLNPADHVDPIGTVILPIFFLLTAGSFLGWAKPTPFNPWNLRNPKRDAALISLAGPASNLLLAVILSIPFRLGLLGQFNIADFFIHSFTDFVPIFFAYSPAAKLTFLFSFALFLNILLAIFNLLPIHPLDGFKVVGGLLPKDLYFQWIQLERYGLLILLFVLILGGSFLSALISPVIGFILGLLIG